MAEIRPIITYRTEPISAADVQVQIDIDHPFNGFFGQTIVVPVPTGKADEKKTALLKWVQSTVEKQVGEAAKACTYRAA